MYLSANESGATLLIAQCEAVPEIPACKLEQITEKSSFPLRMWYRAEKGTVSMRRASE